MTFRVVAPPLAGWQPIAVTETTKMHELGTIVQAFSPVYGAGEFIYLLGVVSTVVGSVAHWNATTFQTTLTTNAQNQGRPVGVAMSANVASQYGWYQIAGNAVVKKTNVQVLPNVLLYMSGTAGRVKVIASAGRELLGARSANLSTVTTTTSTVVVTLNRPHLQGQIT